jgi:thioredoxin-related protein
MKNIKFLIFFLMLSVLGQAQIKQVNNLDQAKADAQKEQKNIMIVFSGSDWCVPCMRLEKEILSQPDFEDLEANKIVLLKADFPSRKKNIKLISKAQQAYNAKLFDKYNPKAIFPLVVLLNSKGHVIAETGYKKMSPERYATYINSLIATE